MSIVDRAKNILLNPVAEWEVIAKEENASPVSLITGYAAPLALISSVIGIIAALLFGAALAGYMGGAAAGAVSAVSSIITAIVGFFLGLALVFGMGYIVSALAPSFGGSSDPVKGAKLIVYSGTPVWIAGFLAIIPIVGGLLVFVGLAYACYLIAIGIRPVLGIPQEKTAGMAIVTLLIYFVGAIIVGVINFVMAGAGAIAAGGAMS